MLFLEVRGAQMSTLSWKLLQTQKGFLLTEGQGGKKKTSCPSSTVVQLCWWDAARWIVGDLKVNSRAWLKIKVLCVWEAILHLCVCRSCILCLCVCVCVCRWSHSSCVKSPVHPLTPIWPKNNTPRQSKSDDLGFWTLLFNGFPKVNPVTFRKNILFSSCFGFSKCSAASDLQICPLNLPQVIKSVTLWCLKGHYVVMENTFKLRIRY